MNRNINLQMYIISWRPFTCSHYWMRRKISRPKKLTILQLWQFLGLNSSFHLFSQLILCPARPKKEFRKKFKGTFSAQNILLWASWVRLYAPILQGFLFLKITCGSLRCLSCFQLHRYFEKRLRVTLLASGWVKTEQSEFCWWTYI